MNKALRVDLGRHGAAYAWFLEFAGSSAALRLVGRVLIEIWQHLENSMCEYHSSCCRLPDTECTTVLVDVEVDRRNDCSLNKRSAHQPEGVATTMGRGAIPRRGI